MFFFFFFNDTATTEIYTLSLHDALPISAGAPLRHRAVRAARPADGTRLRVLGGHARGHGGDELRGRAGVGESKRHRNAAISSSNAAIWPPRVEDGTRMTVRTPVARHASTPSRTSLALPNSVTSVSQRSD